MTLWIILGIIAVVIIWAVSAYNGLVKLKKLGKRSCCSN